MSHTAQYDSHIELNIFSSIFLYHPIQGLGTTTQERKQYEYYVCTRAVYKKEQNNKINKILHLSIMIFTLHGDVITRTKDEMRNLILCWYGVIIFSRADEYIQVLTEILSKFDFGGFVFFIIKLFHYPVYHKSMQAFLKYNLKFENLNKRLIILYNINF